VLLAWQAQVVAMVASLQGQLEDTSVQDAVLAATAVLVVLDPGRIALLAESGAAEEATALCRMLVLVRGNIYRIARINMSGTEETSMWSAQGEISLAFSVFLSCC